MTDMLKRNRVRATAIIIKDSKVLLMHRKKKGEEYWVLPGGGIEENETAEEAVIREVWEETGLKVLQAKFAFTNAIHDNIEHPFFYCDIEDGEPVLNGPEKVVNCEENWHNPEWIDLEIARQLAIYPATSKKLLE